MFNSISNTSEIDRIRNIPRRRLEDYPPDLADRMTEVLRLPHGKMRLRPIQAIALYEIGTYRGLFAPIPVGHGKTLITLLAPYVIEAERPVLLLPASLVQKTKKEMVEVYAQHWRVPKNIRIMSYSILGTVQGARDLEKYKPDLIMGDEIHRLKNLKAAVSRRVARYMAEYPETPFLALSGSIMNKEFQEFAHIAQWSLKGNAPVPSSKDELREWGLALNEKVSDFERYEPGALLTLSPPEDSDADAENETELARRRFRRRLLETPGVVSIVGKGEEVSASLRVFVKRYDVKPITEKHFQTLRNEWVTPDGWVLERAADVWRHARELALGLHYVWDPRPPQDWVNARREWGRFVRAVLARSRTLDSELQVAQACERGILNADVWEAWRNIRDTFRPNIVPIWHDDSVLKLCSKWMEQPGIVWTKHTLFAQKLSEVTGASYFGENGFDSKGNYIEDAGANQAIIASVDANREGKNLQHKWWRNLLTCPLESATATEQLIGRTHRTMQPEDEVIMEILMGCSEHANALRTVLSSARVIEQTTGSPNKLLIADRIDWPTEEEVAAYVGARWSNTTEEQQEHIDGSRYDVQKYGNGGPLDERGVLQGRQVYG